MTPSNCWPDLCDHPQGDQRQQSEYHVAHGEAQEAHPYGIGAKAPDVYHLWARRDGTHAAHELWWIAVERLAFKLVDHCDDERVEVDRDPLKPDEVDGDVRHVQEEPTDQNHGNDGDWKEGECNPGLLLLLLLVGLHARKTKRSLTKKKKKTWVHHIYLFLIIIIIMKILFDSGKEQTTYLSSKGMLTRKPALRFANQERRSGLGITLEVEREREREKYEVFGIVCTQWLGNVSN